MRKLFIGFSKITLTIMLLSSCKMTIYKLEGVNDSSYLIQKRNTFEFYIPPKIQDGGIYYQAKSNEFDSLISSFESAPYEGVSYTKRIEIKESMLVIKHNKVRDTLFLVKDSLQFDKEILFNGQFFNIFAFSDDVRKLLLFGGKYSVKYVGDSALFFANQPPVKIHLFNYYPITSDTKGHENEFGYPLRIGFSSDNGAPLIMSFYSNLSSPYIEKVKCVDYVTIYSTKKRIKKLLMP